MSPGRIRFVAKPSLQFQATRPHWIDSIPFMFPCRSASKKNFPLFSHLDTSASSSPLMTNSSGSRWRLKEWLPESIFSSPQSYWLQPVFLFLPAISSNPSMPYQSQTASPKVMDRTGHVTTHRPMRRAIRIDSRKRPRGYPCGDCKSRVWSRFLVEGLAFVKQQRGSCRSVNCLCQPWNI